MGKIKLSIIIPVYNVEKYIRKCLDSIFSQDVDNSLYEVIVVNDGTPDNSVSIIHEFTDKYPNCRLVNQKNQGLSVARNTGLDVSCGKYIWFVDSDDWLFPRSLSTILNYIEKYKPNVISSILIKTYPNRNDVDISILPNETKLITSYDYLLGYPVGASQRYIICKELMDRYNLRFYPGILHEDGEFGPRLICAANKILVIKEGLYAYFQRGTGSIMSSWSLKNTKSNLVTFDHDLHLVAELNDHDLKNAVLYESLMTLLFSFPEEQVKTNKEIAELYTKYRGRIRKIALKLLLSHLPLKNKKRCIAALVNPFILERRRIKREKNSYEY